jgi:hypothetical protein
MVDAGVRQDVAARALGVSRRTVQRALARERAGRGLQTLDELLAAVPSLDEVLAAPPRRRGRRRRSDSWRLS